MRLLFVTLTFMFLCSCSTVQPVVCSVEKTVSGAVSASLASTLSCTNLAIVQADVLAALGKANMCSTTAAAVQLKAHLKGPVGDIACPLAVNAVMSLLSAQVPESWGCAPGATLTGLSTVLAKACSAVVPI